MIFFSADSDAAPDQILPSCSAALVSSSSSENCSALRSRSATCVAICSGWPVTICGRKVIGPPEDAVASIALEFGKVSIGPRGSQGGHQATTDAGR